MAGRINRQVNSKGIEGSHWGGRAGGTESWKSWLSRTEGNILLVFGFLKNNVINIYDLMHFAHPTHNLKKSLWIEHIFHI